MKKIICVLLSLLLVLQLCGCEPKPEVLQPITSFDEFLEKMLSEADTVPKMEALFPSDGDLSRMTRSRASCLLNIYSGLYPGNGLRVYKIHGKEALDQLVENGILTDKEAENLDAGVFYEVIDDLQISSVMRFFYGKEMAEAMTWDDPTRIAAASGYSFFKGGSLSFSPDIKTDLITVSSGDNEMVLDLMAVSYDKNNSILTDVMSGYPAALKVKGGKTLEECLKSAGLEAGSLGAIRITLLMDGGSVYISGCEKRHNGGYTVTSSTTLRVRSGPSTNDKVLGSLESGQMVTVYEENNGWGRVCYNGKTGWISLEYAEMSKKPLP